MGFKETYAQWLGEHLSNREGESERRLRDGHGHAEELFAEKVWWPAFGHWQHLHPEYEVTDFKDGYRYLDFAYLRAGLQLAIEIDGYGPHLRNISRIQFADQCRRQNDLILDGWKILRFTYDDVNDRPRYCQQTLQQFMGRWLGEERQVVQADYQEKEILRLFLRMGGPVTPGDISQSMGVGTKTAQKWLRQLTEKRWIQPASGSVRIRSYLLTGDARRLNL
ncbi:MAG: DNA-binding response regulator [Paenibacillus sp.]|uniref:DNA-binding response regulator n=1 Tax=Paenibacillus sp. TaxID=58172 RepID=UPI0029053535|nr:DNA-binding response regulator [Paenibacillus sp.]MDU2240045.1 DNA-binding response regulator [Paenibacillus sp.]